LLFLCEIHGVKKSCLILHAFKFCICWWRLSRPWACWDWGFEMFVSCEFCMLSGRILCDGPILRPGESYTVCHWVWKSEI